MTADVRDPMGRAPLHYAAVYRPAAEVAALLADGADIAAEDKQGFTALHFACQENRLDVAGLLLEAGAPVDPVDQWGNTPLWRAVFNANGDARVVRRLVLAGADPDKANAAGKTPRELAARSPTTTPASTSTAQSQPDAQPMNHAHMPPIGRSVSQCSST